jgi:hypothetical protein
VRPAGGEAEWYYDLADAGSQKGIAGDGNRVFANVSGCVYALPAF